MKIDSTLKAKSQNGVSPQKSIRNRRTIPKFRSGKMIRKREEHCSWARPHHLPVIPTCQIDWLDVRLPIHTWLETPVMGPFYVKELLLFSTIFENIYV